MSLVTAQVIFQHVNGLSKDRYINTFDFITDTPADEADFDAIADALTQFYNGDGIASGANVGNYLADNISRGANASEIRLYVNPNLGVPGGSLDMGSPDYVRQFTLVGPSSSADMPGEVAMVLTFHALLDGTTDDRRKRGRIYLGPLNDHAKLTDANGDCRPRPDMITALNNAAELMQEVLEGQASTVVWVVFSNTYGTSWPVVGGWCDNAFDTQRRRGVGPTLRTSWVAAD